MGAVPDGRLVGILAVNCKGNLVAREFVSAAREIKKGRKRFRPFLLLIALTGPGRRSDDRNGPVSSDHDAKGDKEQGRKGKGFQHCRHTPWRARSATNCADLQ